MIRSRAGLFDDVDAFIAIVDHGSQTAAATALGTTTSALSRALARLEQRLGVQLLRRTTRRLSVTEVGQTYLDQARQAVALMDDAERTIRGRGEQIAGRVRLSVPTSYGHYRLPPKLRVFAQRYPRVDIELAIGNRNVDLAAEGFDIAIRAGELPDSSLVAHRLEDAALCLVAAPAYLERAGTPAAAADLAAHACLPFVMPSTGRLRPWLLREGGRDIDWLPAAHCRVSEDILGVVSLAEAGLGICQTFRFIAAERLARGVLHEVLAGASGRTRPFSLLFAPHRRLSAATRALIDVLRSEAARDATDA